MKRAKNQLNIFDEKPRPNTPKSSNQFKIVSVERNSDYEKHQAIYKKFLALSNHLDKKPY